MGEDHGWSEVGRAWLKWHPRYARQSQEMTEVICEIIHVRRGMNVLDLACGSGEPCLTISERIGPTGRVSAVDAAQSMIDVAKENVKAKGLTNVDFKLVDVSKGLPFGDKCFDAVTCRLGVMFFSDPKFAMEECLRVLKTGGKIVLIAWGSQKSNPRFNSTFPVLAKYLDAEKAKSAADPAIFHFQEVGSLSGVLKDAGFASVSEEHKNIQMVWDGPPEEAWECFIEISGPFRKLYLTLPATDRESIAREVLQEFKKYYDGKEVNFPARIVVASGTKH
jgi:ubiquinone/menaquinone biosynthesis C-methylase UbiE